MIVAPDVFDTANGTYTPTIATAWVAHHGTPTALHLGRTLRHTTDHGWEVAPASTGAKLTWKPLAKATKTIKGAFDAAGGETAMAEGYYELIGPGLGGNPHGRSEGDFALIAHGEDPLDSAPPRTSLYALHNWARERPELQGILWTWYDPDATETRYAAVRRSLLLP